MPRSRGRVTWQGPAARQQRLLAGALACLAGREHELVLAVAFDFSDRLAAPVLDGGVERHLGQAGRELICDSCGLPAGPDAFGLGGRTKADDGDRTQRTKNDGSHVSDLPLLRNLPAPRTTRRALPLKRKAHPHARAAGSAAPAG